MLTCILLAQLKVNLRPLWSPANEALASLANRFGDVIWQHLFAELKHASSPQQPQLPHWASNTDDEDRGDEPREEERSWRDPSAHKVRSAARAWTSAGRANNIIISVSQHNGLDWPSNC